jgi:hypothetical protein
MDERGKQPFLSAAAALLFPIKWPEPFGLVMIEAMACGTPVIAYRAGSVPEVIDEGVTGFIVENEAEAVRAVKELARIDRRKVRARFEERFTSDRMAGPTRPTIGGFSPLSLPTSSSPPNTSVHPRLRSSRERRCSGFWLQFDRRRIACAIRKANGTRGGGSRPSQTRPRRRPAVHRPLSWPALSSSFGP